MPRWKLRNRQTATEDQLLESFRANLNFLVCKLQRHMEFGESKGAGRQVYDRIAGYRTGNLFLTHTDEQADVKERGSGKAIAGEPQLPNLNYWRAKRKNLSHETGVGELAEFISELLHAGSSTPPHAKLSYSFQSQGRIDVSGV